MEFGALVVITAKLRRGYIETPGESWFKGWKRVPFQDPVNGIYLGKRTVSKGRTVYDHDEGAYYEPLEYTKVFLVAVSARENPVYVLPEDVEEVDERVD